MPELPEVETVKNGLKEYCLDQIIKSTVVRQSKLRWQVPDDLSKLLSGQKINSITRRGKYLLFNLDQGTLIVHLGMSGIITVVKANTPIKKHDHVDINFSKNEILRYNDPRRFGSILYTDQDINQHKLINHLGPEPLSQDFNTELVVTKIKNKKVPIKTWLMNASNVVGVGNIYANEVLFLANIHPLTPAGKLTKSRCENLVFIVKKVIQKAIEAGGTTLKDFKNADGKPGYFKQQLHVYGRAGEACDKCSSILEEIKISGRQTVFCKICQPL